MIVNFAERAHNHNWELDPVTRSLLDTDFYKLLMLQFIWKHYPKTRVFVLVVNRSFAVRLADMFPREEVSAPDGARPPPAVSQVGTGVAGGQYFLWPARNLSSPHFWSGWNVIFVCPTMSSRLKTASSICRFDGFGPKRRCGSFMRFPS